ncbi:MAG: UbiX family flavin prenyltransferase [Rikenellaceae bacterium]|nr:UbiX family flavin prenyltransferase [Rikenellaceae bacterium]
MGKIIVGITGATGVEYGIKALEMLGKCGVETHLVVSRSAERVIELELGTDKSAIRTLADMVYEVGDIGAPIASGSYKTDGMLIAPCTVKTLSEIATGVTSSLLTRAADVCLKERRRVVLMFRETPLHLGHIRSMAAVTEMGVIVMPPIPSLYSRPQSVDDLIAHSVARALDLFGLDCEIPRWGGDPG